jgi:tetratricopeptide (TPR) repeat protein
VLQSSATLLNDDIGQLRKFHLIAMGSELPGGPRIELPTSIQLLADLMKKRVRDPNWIEKECQKIRDKEPDPSSDIGRFTARVLALWRDGKLKEALDLALVAEKQFPSHADIKCLVGRAYLSLTSPEAQKADVAFHQASELKCYRPEFLSLWLQAKALLNDWMGILEITKDYPPTPKVVLAKARAYSALAEIALQTSNFRRAANHFLAGAVYVDESLRHAESGLGQAQLNHWKNVLFNSSVLALDRDPQPDEQRLAVWQACLDIFRRGTIAGTSVISVGAKNLAAWWTTVERRDRHDPRAGQIMQQQLKALHNMIGDAVAKELRGAEEELRNLQILATDLQRRCNEYIAARKIAGD